MKRSAQPDEIGSAITFFASAGSTVMIGSETYVDGGEREPVRG